MTKQLRLLVVVAVAATFAVVVGLILWGIESVPPPTVPPAVVASVPAAPASSIPASPQPSAQQSLEVPATSALLGAEEVAQALTDLLGRKSVETLLQIDEFPRRLVATVDNLGRSHAPPMLWPVNPTPDRFTVEEHDGGPVISADNAARYTPFVLLVETVDVGRAVDLYVRMYPLLQRTYQELGYPNRNFNDRLIEVIDLLLATPDAEYPVKLQLTEVKGSIPSLRPWVRYQFADPAFESLSAGQKILLRVGPVNLRRLKGKLTEIREKLIKRSKKR